MISTDVKNQEAAMRDAVRGWARARGSAGGIGASFLLAAPAAAQQTAAVLQWAPPAERLTLAGVFAHATGPVQAAFAILIAAALAALAVWASSLGKVGGGDAKGVAAALGRLRIVRSGGAPLGLLAASYTLFACFLGMANVRPAPSLTVLAPGFAEAALAVMLGLLATTVAVICERHLEGRLRQAAA
jgi:hypothetical protein